MTTTSYLGIEVELNDEGFFTDPSKWREEMAPIIAKEIGIDELTNEHWQIIRFVRDRYLETGGGPSVRVLGKTSGVAVKDLYRLFPKGPAKQAARIAGIPKPVGCI